MRMYVSVYFAKENKTAYFISSGDVFVLSLSAGLKVKLDQMSVGVH